MRSPRGAALNARLHGYTLYRGRLAAAPERRPTESRRGVDNGEVSQRLWEIFSQMPAPGTSYSSASKPP